MIGYARYSMGLDRDNLVKVKSSQFARTQRALCAKGSGIDVKIIDFSKVFD
jgi:hypothetical protein